MVIEFATGTFLCAVMAMHHESGNQPDRGQLAVATVLFNRADSRGVSVCEALYEDNQFSFVREVTRHVGAKKVKVSFDFKQVSDKTLKLAQYAIANKRTLKQQFGERLWFFHNDSVKPYWARRSNFAVRIQDHSFYQYPEDMPLPTFRGI